MREWRATGFDQPVLISRVPDAVQDRITGLNLGAWELAGAHLMVETPETNLGRGKSGCRALIRGGIIAGIGCGAGFSAIVGKFCARGRLGLFLCSLENFGDDYLTIKYNATGQQQWIAQYNGEGNLDDHAVAIVVDVSGNVYATGFDTNTVTLHCSRF